MLSSLPSPSPSPHPLLLPPLCPCFPLSCPRVTAGRAPAADNAALIDNMVKHGLISSPAVAAAMKQVDRCHYITRADISPASSSSARSSSLHRTAAYLDSPQYIGYGATISAPHMHAMCAELMLPALRRQREDGKEEEGEVRVLDVGSGSGYLLAVMSRLLGERGRVFGIEHIPELVNVSRRNIQADDPGLMDRISIAQGDGSAPLTGSSSCSSQALLSRLSRELLLCVRCWLCCRRLGLPSAAPFDAIHVGAAAADVPAALLAQLREGGVLVIPVGEDGGDQTLELIEKGKGGQLKRRTVTGVRYVPLTSAEAQRSRG